MKRFLILLFFVCLASSLFTGCRTNDPDNLSERPWNSPRGWETGVPGLSNEGR